MIEERIKKYLNDKICKYALLINGEWGCGKTTFIKKYIKEDKKYIYISLYRISDLQELENKIYDQAFKNTEKDILYKEYGERVKKIKKVLGKVTELSIKNIFSINIKELKEFYKITANLEKYIFVLDDLERCSINIEGVLGYISNLLEQNNCKVIIIANESEIKEDFLAEYKKSKEKVVGETINYNPNLSEILENIICKIYEQLEEDKVRNRKKFKEYIEDNKKSIIDKTNTKNNIRTLQFFLVKFYELIDEIYKDNSINIDMEEEKLVFSRISAELYDEIIKYKHPNIVAKEDENLKWNIKESSFEFIKKYINKNYICLKDVKNEIENYVESLSYKEYDGGALDDLKNNWCYSTEEKVRENLDGVLIGLEKEIYDINNFPRILYLIIKLKVLGFEDKFLDKAIENMKKKISKKICNRFDMFEVGASLSVEEKELKVDIETLLHAKRVELEKYIEESNSRIIRNSITEINIQSKEDIEKWLSELNGKELFRTIDSEKLEKVLASFNVEEISRFRSRFNRRIVDKESVKKIIELMKFRLEDPDNKFDLIKIHVWKWVINDFEEIETRIKNS